MDARSAAKLPMQPLPALNNLTPIVTPLVATEWEIELKHAHTYIQHAHVPYGISHGFDMGVHTSPLVSFTPPNHKSALIHPLVIQNHLRTERAAGRYTGPFSKSRLENLIGPFRTAPLGTVDKAGSPGELRIIQDFSYPRDPSTTFSVNSEINMDNFTCDWGTFQDIVKIVIEAPPFTEAATLDVDAAYRRCPIQPSQQRHFVVMWDNLFYIDHNAPFGTASSGGVFGSIADAMRSILTARNMSPVRNWVNDFVFFRSPNTHNNSTPTYSLDDIYSLGDRLGWPWKRSKTRPFANTFIYLGLLWDLSAKTVTLPEAKRLRYLNRLLPWLDRISVDMVTAQHLLGTLNHCTLVIPSGRSYTPRLSTFTASWNFLKSPYIKQKPPRALLADLSWWHTTLSHAPPPTKLSLPPPISRIQFFVNASSSFGIGIVLENEWDSWKLIKGWNRDGRDIGWAEAVAIEIGLLLAIARGFTHLHIPLRSDNEGVIHSIAAGRSRNPTVNLILRNIFSLIQTHNIWLSVTYIESTNNLADKPSRGIPPNDIPRTSTPLSLPPHLSSYLTHPPLTQT